MMSRPSSRPPYHIAGRYFQDKTPISPLTVRNIVVDYKTNNMAGSIVEIVNQKMKEIEEEKKKLDDALAAKYKEKEEKRNRMLLRWYDEHLQWTQRFPNRNPTWEEAKAAIVNYPVRPVNSTLIAYKEQADSERMGLRLFENDYGRWERWRNNVAYPIRRVDDFRNYRRLW